MDIRVYTLHFGVRWKVELYNHKTADFQDRRPRRGWHAKRTWVSPSRIKM